MAVVANFSATPVAGASPLAVQFTDLSTGSPDKWLWDFGDGNYSNTQNPSHTYTGEAGTTFLVKLTVWVSSSDSPVNEGTSSRQTKATGPISTNAGAFSNFTGLSYGANVNDQTTYLNFNYGGTPNQYGYIGGRVLHTNTNFAAISGSDVIILAEAMRKTVSDLNPSFTITKQGGSMRITAHTLSGDISGIGTTGMWEPVLDITSLGGVPNFSWDHQPVENILQDVGVSTYGGLSFAVRFRKYVSTSPENKDEYTGQIVLVGGEVDFVGTPLSGTSPLEVQFTDLSTVTHAFSTWDFGDGNRVTFAGETHPLNTYISDACTLGLV